MTPAQQLQTHLKAIIDQAKAQSLCPPGWGSNWGAGMCECLLGQRTLAQWLAVTPEMIGQSRSIYYPAKKAGRAADGWKPWHIPESGINEDDWERQKQEQETKQERQQTAETLEHIHGTEGDTDERTDNNTD